MAESLEAGYLGVATDPPPNDYYTVSGVIIPLPTPETQLKVPNLTVIS
jgi:hypothetical protein